MSVAPIMVRVIDIISEICVNFESAEHIYEGFWIKSYMDKVKSDLYGGTSCENYATTILKLGQSAGALNEFADRLLSALGNHNNYGTTMTLLNGRENAVKHRVR